MADVGMVQSGDGASIALESFRENPLATHRIGPVFPKLKEYQGWGVKHIWVADPGHREFFTYGESGLREVAEFQLATHGITLTLNDIFEVEP